MENIPKENYHKRPEWSYSEMKKIIDSGIDYAVAAKRGGVLPPIASPAIDLGQLVHTLVLGGDKDDFAMSEFDNFRTKAAQQWRDDQLAAGKNIITAEQLKTAEKIASNVQNHPLSGDYLLGDGWQHEIEMYASTADGVKLRGKADALKTDGNSLIVSDLKTTAQFDKFAKNAYWSHYDLQAVVYMMIAASAKNVLPGLCNYYFCVTETVAPYRVQFFHSSIEFIESGERKLRRCIDEIIKFGDREPNFLLPEIGELGDWSL